MAVMIEGMEMPKSCTDCEMTFEDSDKRDICEFTSECVGYYIRTQQKSLKCPLVEIEEPKTGKWISKYRI